MDSSVITKANKGLKEAVESLQAQVASLEKKLNLCHQVISEFGHFVPSVIENFKNEMKVLDEADTVVGDVLEEDSDNSTYPIYTTLNKDGSVSSS
jgi:DUF4097 and DUF4098 domain-containing protein YvlB